MIRQSLLLMLCLQLTACGGGGDGDSGSSGGSQPAAPVETSDSRFEDLVIPEGFKFKSAYPVTVSIDLDTRETLFLNIYGRYTEATDGTPIPDSSSRLISGPMQEGKFKGKLTITSQRTSLLVEAWFQDGTRQPFRQIISLPTKEIVITD
ncbi:hypothetical protein [Photobacterium sanguinicancri]|uniref:Uncharacterized protein n=1 Tax=Photobacterium sanguinicancri TaxID=875932 RepID=A0ABX4FYT9_9GAMM|nr:hypothetical protein [Photobacterium sanguinicancri]OZS44014.1 hypothetical protein ASV53_10220 [Photobacterium sanguinicancri]